MMAGVATVTIVVSTRIMKKPRHKAKSAGHGLTSAGTGARVGAAWAMTAVNTRPPTLIPPISARSASGRVVPMSHVDLMAGPPPTHLPVDPADAELAAGDAPGVVVRRHPGSPTAWAALADQAGDDAAD